MKLKPHQIKKARHYIGWHFRLFDMLPTDKSVTVHCMLCGMSRGRGEELAALVYGEMERSGLVTTTGQISGRRHIAPGRWDKATRRLSCVA